VGLQGVGLEDMYLVVVVVVAAAAAVAACNVLWCPVCSSYTVLVRLLVGGRVVCQATDVAAASWTGSYDLPRPVFCLKYAGIIIVCNADFFVSGP
jgi:hypothetical protein